MNTVLFRAKANEIVKTARSNPFVILLLLISIVGFFQSARFGGASLDYYFVKNSVDDWQSNIETKTQNDYLRANSAIADAQRSHPTHPLYRDLQGQLLEWGALAGFVDPNKALNEAKGYYLNAIKLRPTWPVSYASLAVLKWRLGEFDDELAGYLDKANSYGPLKAEVHVLFVELGLSLYSVNHPFFIELQPHMKQRLSYAMRNAQSRTRALASIKELGQVKTACRWMRSYDPYTYKSLLRCS